MFKEIKVVWKTAFAEKEFKKAFWLSLFLLAVTLPILSRFLTYNESRTGVSFPDPYMSRFQPVDLTWLIFGLIYVGLLAGIILLLKHPKNLLFAIQTYALLAIFRMIAMYSLPLEPPPNTIPLIDPFIQLFGSGDILMKDLFFSGHTSTMTLLFLTAATQRVKTVYFIGIFLVGAAVLFQQTHYSVDVIAAPFFAYGSYRLAKYLDAKVFGLK
ncbi:MAG: hypothetical protein GXO87_00945 [Chlorobi bacterium]|nr:hypothetical protein [Chlorobiota bacterium]